MYLKNAVRLVSKSIVLASLLCAGVLNSYAGTVVCGGTVQSVAYHTTASEKGQLMIKLSGMNTPVFICSPDVTWAVGGTTFTTTAASCKAMYASFLAAKASGTPISTIYFDGDQVPAACNAWAAWSVANVRYFEF